MMRFSKCSKYESSFKFTWERVFCEKYIWFEKVASWHDVRLHKDHSLKTLCSIISQSLRYASECMRIDVAHKCFGGSGEEECLSFYKFQKFLMSSKDKTLGKLWGICMYVCVICNHNMKGNFFLKRTRISPHSIYPYNIANTRNFYILYKWNGTNALFSLCTSRRIWKAKMIHICINFCALNVKT